MSIKELIKTGESETLDFKENFMKEVIETVVAFANNRGGQILIGVDDRGNVKGVSISRETTKNWINGISIAIEPKITISMQVKIVNEKTVVIIDVPEAPIKPIGFKGRCYRRSATSNKLMTPTEIAEMHLFSTGASWDALESDAKIKDLDLSKVKKYVQMAKESGRKNFKEDSLIILKKIGLVKKNSTWAGILLFGKEPDRFSIMSPIHCGRFKLDKTEILDDLMIQQNLIDQVDEAMNFIKKHISVKYEFEGTPRRREVWEYPLNALREAVINAIVHKDYSMSSHTTVEIYDDKMQIWNPGKLPPGLTIQDLYNPEHKSIIRNKLIAQVFYDIGFIEKYGSGIGRIIESCYAHGLPSPEFGEFSGGFSIIFRKDIFTEKYLRELGLNERQIKAVGYFKEKGRITNKEYQQIANTIKRTASRDLKELIDKDVLIKIGDSGKGTYYTLKGTNWGHRGHSGDKKETRIHDSNDS